MKLVIALALAAFVAAVPVAKLETSSTEDALWQRFKMTYNKVYFDSRDETYRKFIFTSNLRMIQKHNEDQEQGKHTYTLAMNEFGDLTFEEFHARYTGYKGPKLNYLRSMNTANLSHVAVADSIDWVEKGAVTPVKNQGQCGSCWAFSSTGAIEGAWFVAKGQLEDLSEQELMDCSKSEGNNSCEGGLMDYAFEFVVKNKGICAESAYAYKAQDENSCKTCTSVAEISSFKDVGQTEADLMAAVTQQPVAVAIEADQSAFQFYSSGVLTGKCGTNLDHGVLAVGYGTLDGVQYWKVKNSWGASWGMKGYVLIEKGKAQSGGQCGILKAASYPVV
jgi:C1A family cysteine protease